MRTRGVGEMLMWEVVSGDGDAAAGDAAAGNRAGAG